MAKFTSTVALNIAWHGHEFVGAAGTVFLLDDALYDEFNAQYASVIPGLTWSETESYIRVGAAVVGHAIGGSSHSGTLTNALHGTLSSGDLHPEYLPEAGGTMTGNLNAKTLNSSVIFADQYSSIQAAHDALPVTGGTIFVPAGTYLTSGASPILSVTKSNFRLIGAGRGATIFAFSTSQAIYLIDGNAVLEDITIEGIEFDGRNLHASVPDVTAIRFAGTPAGKRITVRDCYIHDMPGTNETFGINFGNVLGGVIHGVYVSNCGGSGIALAGATAVAISDCIAERCGWMGFTISSTFASDSLSREITLSNCVSRNNTLYGFNIESTEHATLSNLVAKGNGRWGFAFSGSGVAGMPDSRYISGVGIIAANNATQGAGYDGIIFAGSATAGASFITLAGVVSRGHAGFGAKSGGQAADNTISGDLRGNTVGEADFANGPRNYYSRAYNRGGTTFPASPATDDLFYRTDRRLLYFWDGTRWLTTTIFTERLVSEVAQPAAATFSLRGLVTGGNDAVWLENFRGAAFISTTNDPANHWDFTVFKTDDVTNTEICVAFSSLGGGAGTWFPQTRAIIAAAQLVSAATDSYELICTKVGTPSDLREQAELTYRLVG